jgi:hypothetical protein
MRTPLVLLFGSLLVSCTVGDPGSDDDDGGGGGANCGNGQVDPGEECDGGATCSATCTLLPVPKLDIRVDKPTIATELRTSNMVTATLVGSNGFGGSVPITAKVYDANNVELTAWTVTLNSPNANVPVDGSADVVVSVAIPSENKGLTGTLKITATPAAGGPAAQVATTAITAANQVSLPVTMNGGLCVYTGVQGQTKITVGTKVKMVNKGTASMIFHSDGGTAGLPHQDTNTTTAINASYDNTIIAVTGQFNWYCHSPGPTPPSGTVTILPVAAVQ